MGWVWCEEDEERSRNKDRRTLKCNEIECFLWLLKSAILFLAQRRCNPSCLVLPYLTFQTCLSSKRRWGKNLSYLSIVRKFDHHLRQRQSVTQVSVRVTRGGIECGEVRVDPSWGRWRMRKRFVSEWKEIRGCFTISRWRISSGDDGDDQMLRNTCKWIDRGEKPLSCLQSSTPGRIREDERNKRLLSPEIFITPLKWCFPSSFTLLAPFPCLSPTAHG